MLESSFRVVTIAGIRIGVHYTWFIIFVLFVSSLFALFMQSHPEWSTVVSFVTAVITALLFFVSIILHELGHSLVAISRGMVVQSITLFIFGGLAQTEKEADTATTEFLVSIAGPIVSFTLAGLFYLLNIWLGPYSDIAMEVLDWLASINLVVGIFNLVPGFPLDGGRVFRALVWWITGNATKGMQWAVVSGKIVAYGLMVLGMMSVIQTGLLLNGLWLMAIGFFLLHAAEASGRAYVMERLVSYLKVGDIMQKEMPQIAADISILEWVDKHVLLTGRRACLVKQGERIIGLVALSDAIKQPRDQWASTPVREVMTPTENLYTVSISSDINEVLRTMHQHSINQVPVVDAGHITGWIDRQHILTILQLHTETERLREKGSDNNSSLHS